MQSGRGPLSPTFRILGRVAIALAARRPRPIRRARSSASTSGPPSKDSPRTSSAPSTWDATAISGRPRWTAWSGSMAFASRCSIARPAEGIGSNRFSSMLETPDGTLWFGTENGGITRYAGGRFQTYTTRDGLASNAVAASRQTRAARCGRSPVSGSSSGTANASSPMTAARFAPLRSLRVVRQHLLGGRRPASGAIRRWRAVGTVSCRRSSTDASAAGSKKTRPGHDLAHADRWPVRAPHRRRSRRAC